MASICNTYKEKLIVWTFLDTGLRVAELANLTKDNLDWQSHRIMVYGKGGPSEPNRSGESFRSLPECSHCLRDTSHSTTVWA
jgi:integrase